MQSPRASAAKDRTPPVLGLRTPQATEPRQAHRTSVLTGDPPHPFPELRQHLQVGHDRGLQIEAGSSSSDGETQGAFLFYGPEDLGKEASVQDTWLRDSRQGPHLRCAGGGAPGPTRRG